MRDRFSLWAILIFLIILFQLFPNPTPASVFVTEDGKTHYIQTVEIDDLEYVSVNNLSSMLGAEVYWHRMLRKVTLEFDDHQIAFAWFSPYMLYDSEVYNLGYDTKIRDGTLWVPLAGFQRIYNYLAEPRPDEELQIFEGEETHILDLSVEEKVNGILVEIFTDGPLQYEVFSDQDRDLNVNFYKGKLDTLYFNRKKLPRFVRWVKAFQFENSAQLSLRLRKPFVKFIHGFVDDPYRIQVSLIHTLSYDNTTGFSSPGSSTESQELTDDLIDLIVIDPGHGGPDSGAVGKGGLVEKEVTLDIAKRLRELLKDEEELKVVLTRETDLLVPLEERTQVANRNGADLFVSIHTNASRKRSARGCETFFLSSAKTDEARAAAALENSSIRFERSEEAGGDSDDLDFILMDLIQSEYLKESQDFAAMIQGRLKKSLSIPSRGVSQAGFMVLNNAYMPAVLVETAFISNKKEESLLGEESFRQEIAQALYESIKEFKRKYDSTK